MFNILVCDDDKEIVDAIDIYLSQEGYHILKAYDGLQAIEIMKKEEVHLILLDIMMPNMDGIEATKTIRSLDRADAKSIPIIAMTANAFEDDKEKSRMAGMDAHLSKPIEPELLYKMLSRLISQRKV